ncbi:hypothetical protein ACLE2W_06460 [Pseudomonas shahriarae]|uniref:hypothetical protein n=1 Tax=Pseudomonas shahriarae TaxID=2745512 RepID=UPI00207678F5|nr:hypothetical protein [Pseudomonas shahriarae]MCM8559767.1 hypothetical protein [Pseudomonas shahriarae]
MSSKEPVPEPDNASAFSSVTVCFVPRAFAANPLANLGLVGTLCKYGDKEFRRIEKLKCDLYFPAGTFVALDQNGNIDSIHTESDIGQLDLAFNDYLNFLMDVRRIYEGPGTYSKKLEAVEAMTTGMGRQGHSHGYFIAKHGGAGPLLDKCVQRKR